MPPLPNPGAAATDIADALATFLRRGRISQVYFAEGMQTAPQPLAYLVHFPRLAVTLAGTDSMWIEQDGQASLIHLRRGDAVVVPANRWNRPIWAHSSTSLNLLFGGRQVGLSLVSFDGRGPIPPAAVKVTLPGAHDEAARAMMHALLGLRGRTTQAAPPLIEALLLASREALLSPVAAPQRRAANLHDSICMYVQEHLQFPLTRDSVAAHFRVTPNHVSRLFKCEGLVAFNEYVNFVRINRAKFLLKHYRQSLDEVAAACGFSEAGYFCRVFKKRLKLTPTAYRQAQMQGKPTSV